MEDSKQYLLECLSTLSGNGETVWEHRVIVRDSASDTGSLSSQSKDWPFSSPSRILVQRFPSLDSGEAIYTPALISNTESVHSNDSEYMSVSVHSDDGQVSQQIESMDEGFNVVDKSDKPRPWHTHDAERDPDMHNRAKKALTLRYEEKFKQLDERYQKLNGQSFGSKWITPDALQDRVHKDIMWVRERFYNYYAMTEPPTDNDIISFYDAVKFDIDYENLVDDAKTAPASDATGAKEYRVSKIFC